MIVSAPSRPMPVRSVPVRRPVNVILSLGSVMAENCHNYCEDKEIGRCPFLSLCPKEVSVIVHGITVSEERVRQKRHNRERDYNILLYHHLHTLLTCDITRSKPVSEYDRTRLGHRAECIMPRDNMTIPGSLIQRSSPMSTRPLLNPGLYQALTRHFGQVKIDNPGQRMILRRTGNGVPTTEIVQAGETYRVCCPKCGDSKFKLSVNHAFNTVDPHTGRVIYLNNCHRACGSLKDELLELIEWRSMSRTAIDAEIVGADYMPQHPFISPGTCVALSDPQAKPARDYLVGRGIDPNEADTVYGVQFCIEDSPGPACGGMKNRLICPVWQEGTCVGWQGRLIYEPKEYPPFGRPAFTYSLDHVRWYSMPGPGWRSSSLFGYDQAKSESYCIVVEGPGDVLRQGVPCVASMGQTMSYAQVNLIAQTWGDKDAVILVGDHRKEGGSETEAQLRSAKMLENACQCPVYLPVLPQGDPGSWEREAFQAFIRSHIKRNPGGWKPG